ncbi:uncharacterized protein LOC121413475 [Lytechinus variegatus]|uniref:uncharacterized protein LOC121413475 n=1 Tax=Lytechinus variegatus TaxID=7654 RepID=UPI001BB1DB80|nr:uncharacterized protein LOC121413475 [Lytechinus variegatus]
MLTGTLPFIVEPFNLRKLLSKIQKADMGPLPSGLSSDCKSFVRYLLEPDPEKRPTVYDVLCHPWLAGVYEPLRSLSPTASNHALTPTPPPTPCSPGRRLSRMLLDHDIISYIRETLGIKSTHVSESVLAGRADEYSAIYYLLAKQRERDEVPKIAQRLQENWETFRVCSRQDDGEEDDLGHGGDGVNEAGHTKKNRGGSPRQGSLTNDFDDDEKKKEVAAETALQMAGKKNGSFHFKMAMVIEEEAERAARSPNDIPPSPKETETSAIYREVLGEMPPELPSPSSPAKSISSKDGQRIATPFSHQPSDRHENFSSVNDSRITSAASGNPWLIMLGRERTTSTIRSGISGLDTNRNAHQSGVTTACFREEQVKKKHEKVNHMIRTGRNVESSAKRGSVNGRVSLSTGRALKLTYQQSTDPTVTTFVNHFRHNHLPDRLTRRSNLKNSLIADMTVGGQNGHLNTPKSVTFRRNKYTLEADTRLRETVIKASVANTTGVQEHTTTKAGITNGRSDRKQEEAIRVYRSTRKTAVPRDFSENRRQRRIQNPVKRKPVGRPPVTLSRKPIRNSKGRINPTTLQKQERSAATTTATMSGRPSTSSLQDEQNCIAEATVKGICSCSRAKDIRNAASSKNVGNDVTNFPRRFSTSDEGYDTTHSIDGDSNKKLPDIAPPILSLSPRCLSEAEKVTLSKTMKTLKLGNTERTSIQIS